MQVLHRFGFVLVLSLFAVCGRVSGQVSDLGLLPTSSAANYGSLPVGELNRALLLHINGQFERAMMTYNSALAYQPDWVPALTARAELLTRVGRDEEARKDRLRAQRINPVATSFFLAKGRNGLLPFLALYPRDYYETRYGLYSEQPRELAMTGTEGFFYEQYVAIRNAPDTALAVKALQQKIDQDVIGSERSLNDLPRDYPPSVKSMLRGNLALLNHDYTRAVRAYTDALLKSDVDWPELYYNRGLGFILLHNYVNGCGDLNYAARAGFQPAVLMVGSLCNF